MKERHSNRASSAVARGLATALLSALGAGAPSLAAGEEAPGKEAPAAAQAGGKKSSPDAGGAAQGPALAQAGQAAGAPPPPGPPAAASAAAPNAPAATTAAQAGKPPEESQLSFQGANVEIVMKWLAEVTGKSVARHKNVQCQLTVMSPKKIPTRDAIQLVYRALTLEGFSAIETRNAILLVPEAAELKAASAELVDAERGPLEGKQVLVKVFPVTSTTAERLREKVKGVLSEKGKIDIDEAANKLIVTDFADNLQLLGKLIGELDVASPAQKEIAILDVRHIPAEDLALLITAAFNGDFAGSEAAKEGPVAAHGDAKGNRILIAAPRARMEEVKTLIASLDVEQKADLAVRVLPLQHAIAKELAPEIGPLALKALGSAPGAQVEITPSVRSNALVVLSTAAGFEAVKAIVSSLDAPAADQAVRVLPLQHAIAKELAPEIGPLALKVLGGAHSVEITASARSNALLVLSSAAAFETVKGIVSSLDSPATSRPSPLRIFKLEHAHADRIRDILKPLLSPLGKVEIEEQLRKVIVSDNLDNLHFFEELVRELDVPAAADSQTVVITLLHAEADDLANLLNAVYGEGAKSAAAGPLKPGAVRIFNDDVGNRIVITAGKEKIEDVKSLVATLDAEKPADFTLRVITLQFVNAKDLAEEIEPLYQRSTRASRERVEIAANSRANSLLVLSSASDFTAIQEIVAILDTKDAEEKTMKAYVLKNADADDVATQLGELYQDNGNDDYFSYYYGRRGRSGGDDVKIRFVADRRRNAVIAIAPPARLEGIAPVIQSLDEPIEGEQLVPKIYALKFVSALDVETVLNELFLKKTQRRSYYYYDEPQEDEHRDIGRLYGKIRIASEPYTNSLIVSSNSGENFAAVEEILKQLDVPSQTGSSTLYIQLKYAKAVTIANNINILFAGPGSPARGRTQQEGQPSNQQQQQGQQNGRTNTQTTSFELEDEVQEESYYPWLGGGGGQQDSSRTPGARSSVTRPVSDLVGKVRVVPDVRTNSLMITSNLHFFPQVIKVVEELDIPTSQVLVEAKIIEVGRDAKDRMGVRWSPDGSQVFDRDDLDNSIIASTTTTYRDVFAGSALADAMRTGILDVRVDLDFLIQFLKKNAESRVRAEPRINVADNERGKLFVGSRVPFISSSLTTTEGGRNDAFEYIDVGIILEVTPHINNKNEVDLKIRVESSQIRQGETLFGGAIIDTRNYRTDITVQSGETLVLGGIIQSEESEIERKVPLIGDIPLLGWLFKKRDTVNRDIELMVFLKPTVTQGPEDVRRLMEAETRKTPQIRRFDQRIDAERAMETEALEQELREMEPLPVPDRPPVGTEPPRAPAPAEQPRAPAPAGTLEARSE